MRCMKGRISSELLQREQARMAQLEQSLAGLSMTERFTALTRLMVRAHKASKIKRFENHNFNILINIAYLVDSLPSVVSENRQAQDTLTLPWNLNFLAVKNGEKHILGRWTIDKAAT
jgi:hypothetical protein